VAEKEKESLEGKKAEAEMFLNKQGAMFQCKIKGTEIYISHTEVCFSMRVCVCGVVGGRRGWSRQRGLGTGWELSSGRS
jgi:hypothetical protein